MAKCHIGIKLLENIVALQEANADLPVIKEAWQELYDFSKINHATLRLQLWGKDGLDYFYLLDRALSYPLYHDGKDHHIFLPKTDASLLSFQEKRCFSKEDREALIQKAIQEAFILLENTYSKKADHSSLYQCCEKVSNFISNYLNEAGCEATVLDIRKYCGTFIPHAFCYVEFMGDDGKLHPTFIDATYRQFFTMAQCMQDARELVTEEQLDVINKRYHYSYIAPGLFAGTAYPDKLNDLLTKGYFHDLSSLEMYFNSFVQAELSRTTGDIDLLLTTRKSGEEYWDTFTKKLGGNK